MKNCLRFLTFNPPVKTYPFIKSAKLEDIKTNVEVYEDQDNFYMNSNEIMPK